MQRIVRTEKLWRILPRWRGHIGAVTSVSFPENGFVLATGADDGVKLWDLRYLRNFQSFSPYDQNVAINSVHFDHSNSYLAVGGVDARVYQIDGLKAEWNCIKILPDLSGTGNHYPKDRTIFSELT